MSGQRGAASGTGATGGERPAGGAILWLPLPLAAGIQLWLSWPGEPGRSALLVALLLPLLLPAALWSGHARLSLAALWLAMTAAGFLAAELRAQRLAAPVLTGSFFGELEGRVTGVDRSSGGTGGMRLTLDQLSPGPRKHWPEKVRVTLPPGAADLPRPGERVRLTAWITAPRGPAEPGGFDFARHAWFQGLGAVGSLRGPLIRLPPAEAASSPPGGWPGALAALPQALAVQVAALRLHLSAGLQARIPGEAGAFAAAMMTGDRSGMGEAAVADLRDSNLYHLVSISGVHMSLLAGFVYQSLRFLMALVPPLVLRLPAQKIAAGVALPVSGFYLLLSGGDVATLRAFVMVAVMLGAVLADRRALSLRSVAMAALLILLLRPEGLAEPGFQMSFAATAALIAGLEALRARDLPAWLAPVLLVLAAPLLAGFASAPFAAAHFFRASPLGVLPNLLVSPLMALLVMPGGVLVALLSPLGLEAPALWMLARGCEAVLRIAAFAAGFEAMVHPVARPPAWGLPVTALGGMLLLLLPRGRRIAGVLVLTAGLTGFLRPDRPELLISADGRLLGLRAGELRALSQPRGDRFSAGAWLAADGDLSAPQAAAQRPGFSGPSGDRRFRLGSLRGRVLRALPERPLCEGADLVILSRPAPGWNYPCLVIDSRVLARNGAMALTTDGKGGLRIRSARENPPRRWTPRAPRFR